MDKFTQSKNKMKLSGETDRGVLYVATGIDYIKDAFKSARSVRKLNPQIPIHLFGDLDPLNLDIVKSPFTSWENIPDPHRRSKIEYIGRSPFEETLFLDTDTRVFCQLNDMFEILTRFDIALIHIYKRETLPKTRNWNNHIPRAFPGFNTGVILFKKNSRTINAFQMWMKKYEELQLNWDLPALREVLWQSNLRIATLPPEYNVRFIKYLFIWSKEEAQPKILHFPYFRQGFKYYLHTLINKLQGRWVSW